MKVLSLDPATKTGWAMWENKKLISSGIINFPNSKIHPGQRFVTANQEIKRLICNNHKPYDVIVYEAIKRWSSSQAALVYGGIVSVILYYAALEGIPVVGIAPTEAKKFCTGKGRADKEEMIKWATDNFKKPQDDNEADAIAIGYTYIYGQSPLQESNETPTTKATKPSKKKRAK